MKPVLAESVRDDKHADTLLHNDAWCAQQKIDGQRILVTVNDGHVQFLNRQGAPKQTNVTRGLTDEFTRFTTGDWCFDGEMIDSVFWLFDMSLAGTHVNTDSPLAWRLSVLEGFYAQVFDGSTAVRLLPYAEGTEAKTALLAEVRAFGGEGIMFKDLNARYEPGQRSRHILKHKFTESIDAVVLAVDSNGKENLSLGLYRDGKIIPVGDCTGRAGDGSAAFKPGDVAEVKYLYMGANGRLYQPTFPRKRDDKSPEECTWDQVKHVNKAVVA